MYQRLRNLREDRDLNQTAVAAVLHVSQTTYSRYESGALDIPAGPSLPWPGFTAPAWTICWG